MKGNEISTLYRSYAPRMSQYTPDGKGRDIYINYNNGGFLTKGIKTYSGSQMTDPSAKYQVRVSGKNVAPFKYMSDGSGRDNYVLHESGGLTRNHKSLNEITLKDFLRNSKYDNPKSEGANPKARYISKAEIESNQLLKRLEKGLINRLYTSQKHKFKNPNNDSNAFKRVISVTTENEKNLKNSTTKDKFESLPLITSENTNTKEEDNAYTPLQTDINFFKRTIGKIKDYEKFKYDFNQYTTKKFHIKNSK